MLQQHKTLPLAFFKKVPPDTELSLVVSHMHDTKNSGRALDAETFLLQPVIEYLRGYKKITDCEEVLMNAEEVLRHETKAILAARERVLDAFRDTVDHNSDDNDDSSGGGDTEKQLSRVVHEIGRPSSGEGTRRGRAGRPLTRQPTGMPVVPAVRPEDSMSQYYVRMGVSPHFYGITLAFTDNVFFSS